MVSFGGDVLIFKGVCKEFFGEEFRVGFRESVGLCVDIFFLGDFVFWGFGDLWLGSRVGVSLKVIERL